MVFWEMVQCGGPRRGARHDAGNQRGKRTSAYEDPGIWRHRVDHGALQQTDQINISHAASLAEATPEV